MAPASIVQSTAPPGPVRIAPSRLPVIGRSKP